VASNITATSEGVRTATLNYRLLGASSVAPREIDMPSGQLNKKVIEALHAVAKPDGIANIRDAAERCDESEEAVYTVVKCCGMRLVDGWNVDTTISVDLKFNRTK
jgi:hypothetical protein